MLDKPVSMRSFAWDLECDPSNVTGLVDRAERLDLVERVPAPDDRRVRMLTLTAKGRRVRDEVNRDLAQQLADDIGLCGADRDGTVGLLRGVTAVVDTRRRERE
jgi:DNA-binding MarR family transcriptional regulator